MAIKLDELIGWKPVPRGDVLKFSSDRTDPRKVRIHLNCEAKTWLYADYGELKMDRPQYLATVGPGVETVEFYVAGDVQITFSVEGSEGQDQVWINTAEAEPNVSPNPNAVSFTEIMERVPRDPNMEYVMAVARQNEKRRDEQMRIMREENARAIAALNAERAALVNQGTTAPAPSQPETQPSGGTGGGSESGSGGGSGGSGGS